MYEYRCRHCAEHFERWSGFDDPLPPCPACGATEVNKLVSIFGSKGGSCGVTPSGGFG